MCSLLTGPFSMNLIPCSLLLVGNIQHTSLKPDISISFFFLAISNVLEYSTLNFIVSVHCFSFLSNGILMADICSENPHTWGYERNYHFRMLLSVF